MQIKCYLERTDCLIYPESYYSWQMKAVEEILKIFGNIDITTKEKILQARQQDPNTVVLFRASIPCPNAYKTEFKIESKNTKKGQAFIIKTKNKPVFTLIIREFY